MSAGDDLYRQMAGGGASAGGSRFAGTPMGAVGADGSITVFPASSGGGGGGGLLGEIGGMLAPVEHLGVDAVKGFYNVGQAAYHDVSNPISTIEHPGQSAVWNQVVKPIGEAYAHKYGAVFEHPLSGSAWSQVGHNIAKDPFGSALDALTLATVPFTAGESAAIRAGMLARIAGETADTSSVVRLADKALAARAPLARKIPVEQRFGQDIKASYNVTRARLPVGRMIQDRLTVPLREHPRVAELPIVGAAREPIKAFREAQATKQLGNQALIAKFQRSLTPLSKAEHQAFHVVAEATRQTADGSYLRPEFYRSEREAFLGHQYQAALHEHPEDLGLHSDLHAKLTDIGAHDPKLAAKIDQAITSQSPRLVRALELAREVNTRGADALGLSRDIQAGRAIRPSEIFAGSRYIPPATIRLPGEDAFKTDRAAMTKEARAAQTKLTQAQRRYTSLQERVRSYQTRAAGFHARALTPQSLLSQQARAMKALEQARKDLADAKTAHGFISEGPGRLPGRTPSETVKTEGEFRGPTKPAYPASMTQPGPSPYGENIYFSHQGPQVKQNPSLRLSKANAPLGEIKPPGTTKLMQGLRQLSGRYLAHPEAGITRPAVMAFRHESFHDFQDWLGQHAAHLPDHARVPEGWRAFMPTSEKAARDVAERTALHEGLSSQEHRDMLDEMVKGLLPKGQAEGAKLIVPERYARAMEQEFKSSSALVRNMYDKPMDLWRAVVLKYRPAWLVYNVVGQHMLYALHAAGPEGFIRYLQALRLEKGDGVAQNFLGRIMRVPEFRSRYGAQLEKQGLVGIKTGTTHGTLGTLDQYSPTLRGRLQETHPASYTAATAIPRSTWSLVKSVGDGSARLNQEVADNLPRLALYMKVARNSPAAQRAAERVAAFAKDQGHAVSMAQRIMGPSSEAILKEITPAEHTQLLAQVNKALGNFNTLTPFERRYVRRLFPFVAWFKVIGAISKDLALHNPEKLNLIRNIETAANQNPGLIPKGALPSFLQGAFSVGPSIGGIQPLITTQGINPFATPVQLAKAAASPFTKGARASDSTGVLGPAFQLYDYFQGVNPLTGGAYKGLGSSQGPALRALGGFTAGLPQARLAQQLGLLQGYQPSKTYANTHRDDLLNYAGYPIRKVKMAQAAAEAAKGY